MDYQSFVDLTRLVGLIIFFAMFVAIIGWLFRPGAKQRFEANARIPLED